jgi:two-component system clock-associated histidine kinase SasA
MEDSSTSFDDSRAPLKLLLFIDKRPSLAAQVRQIKEYLTTLETDFAFSLEVVDIGEQPYLAEHYKLVASPALLKIAPPPQQMLAGSDIVNQLERWWPKWQQEHLASLELLSTDSDTSANFADETANPLAYSAELMKLSDEIFRLNQTKEELEAQLRFKDRIISMMAHDLRNPLTAASIAVETLELGYSPNQTRQLTLSPELTGQLLKHAKTQIRAINRMITDILKAARGASMELQLYPQELDLPSLCLEVVDAFQNRIDAKQQRLTTEIPQDLPTVYADGTQVKRYGARHSLRKPRPHL